MAAVPPRVGLVFGAGGIVGGAWMSGALAALMRETGWDPASAELLLGTSAGAVFAGLIAAGVPVPRLLPGPACEWVLAELATDRAYAPGGRGLPLPGSLRMSAAALAQRPTPYSLLRALSGIVPRGRVATTTISATVSRWAGDGWPTHAGCRVVAADYVTGRRVVFGSADAPAVGLAEAVAASCAIPGFFRPVGIGARAYVDGGVHSMLNLDLLCGLGLDLVVCLSPLSTRVADRGRGPAALVAALVSRLAAAELDRWAAVLRREGTDVLVLEPGPREAALMGTDMMLPGLCAPVAAQARRGATARLRRTDLARRLAPLRRAA